MYTKSLWLDYGLGIVDSVDEDDRPGVIVAHDLVANYLNGHSELREQYRADQSGAVKYYDVLRLAGG